MLLTGLNWAELSWEEVMAHISVPGNQDFCNIQYEWQLLGSLLSSPFYYQAASISILRIFCEQTFTLLVAEHSLSQINVRLGQHFNLVVVLVLCLFCVCA